MPFDETQIISCDVHIQKSFGSHGSDHIHVSAVPIDSIGVASFGPWFEFGQSYSLVLTCSNAKGLVAESSSSSFLVPYPPSIGHIRHGQHCSLVAFVQDTSLIQACWPEISGGGAEIQSVVWGLGSKPGLEDIMACKEASQQLGVAILGSGLTPAEYYKTVAVISTAGINSSSTSSVVRLDSSDPKPGIVNLFTSSKTSDTDVVYIENRSLVTK